MPAETQANIDNLKARRTAIIAELAAITTAKPTYSKDGQSVNWTEYRKGLYEELEAIGLLLQQLEGPIMVVSYGRG